MANIGKIIFKINNLAFYRSSELSENFFELARKFKISRFRVFFLNCFVFSIKKPINQPYRELQFSG
jgi:hypothetical protein